MLRMDRKGQTAKTRFIKRPGEGQLKQNNRLAIEGIVRETVLCNPYMMLESTTELRIWS